MQAVIGTAGHVDHGKSTLIQALTGTHPSHLPQELLRGMTIDLGFAHFISNEGDSIGIIDVPGHERFLRNMVSAIWGLDMVLLVIAADEGWSALTEEHLRVIAAFGISQILIVINKCDLADSQRQDTVEETALEHCLNLTNSLPDVVRVSAQTGMGIDNLKKIIVHKLQNATNRHLLNQQAHLYIDRVFSVNGIGTTITGTLRGESITEGQSLTLFPSGKSVRVKSLQSYHQQLSKVEPFSRVAIALKQVKKQEISRGNCLVADASSIYTSSDWIVELRPEFSKMKKQSEVEIAIGTAHSKARCFVFTGGQLARLQIDQKIAAFWGQPLLLIRHGGSAIIGAARLVWAEPINKTERQILQDTLPNLPRKNNAQSELLLRLAIGGYAKKNMQTNIPEGVTKIGDWLISEACQQKLLDTLNKILESSINAVNLEELSSRSYYPSSLIQSISTIECKNNRWLRINEAGFSLPQNKKNNSLPPAQQAILDEIINAGEQGFDANKLQQSGMQKLLRTLVERHLIVPMEEQIFFGKESYQKLLNLLLLNKKLGDKFSIAEARETCGLTRKRLIPLLNRIERDGFIKRIDDAREVCQLPLDKKENQNCNSQNLT